MASDTRGEDTDLTSPELVLVSDAELAQRARDDLPAVPPRDGEPGQSPVARPHRIAEPPPYPQFSTDEPVPRVRRARRRRRRRLLPLVAILLVVAAAAIGWLVLRNPDDNSSTAGGANTPAAFVPARTWVWGASKGAQAYVFQMSLNGKVVAHARTEQPRYELPASFRFSPGNYRWTVQRVPKPADGQPLSDSKFVLTEATAAQANR